MFAKGRDRFRLDREIPHTPFSLGYAPFSGAAPPPFGLGHVSVKLYTGLADAQCLPSGMAWRCQIFRHFVLLWHEGNSAPAYSEVPVLYALELRSARAAMAWRPRPRWRCRAEIPIHQSVVFWARRLINMYAIGMPNDQGLMLLRAGINQSSRWLLVGHAKQAGIWDSDWDWALGQWPCDALWICNQREWGGELPPGRWNAERVKATHFKVDKIKLYVNATHPDKFKPRSSPYKVEKKITLSLQ